uniref:No apical meristem-associated C-terminal domain-containing protein n=1 Tax=Brassica oleracea var. oleracea TaxID=109376 RepID=A0A0D2ZQI5_BRAOL
MAMKLSLGGDRALSLCFSLNQCVWIHGTRRRNLKPEECKAEQYSLVEETILEDTPAERKERRMWTPVEDMVLISSWLNTSKDPVVGNEQRSGTFWKRIAAYFAASPKCWHKINDQVNKFCGAFEAASREKTSGQNENDVLKLAHEIFFNNPPKKIILEHAWKELRNDQKWCELSYQGTAKRRKCDEGSQSETSHANETGTEERPSGVKAAKGKKKKNVEGKETLSKFQTMWEIKQQDLAKKDSLTNMRLLESLLKDGLGRNSLSPIQKCTAAIRVLAYSSAADTVEEYLRLGETTTRLCVENFVEGIIYLFGDEYLRRPTPTDLQRLLDVGEHHGFPRIIGSIDCMHWEWKNCPTAWKGQYSRGSDVERAFGVLQARFAIVKNPALFWDKVKIGKIMRVCIMLHNMIVENERDGYTQFDVSEFQQGVDNRSSHVDLTFSTDIPSNIANMMNGRTRILDRQMHQQLNVPHIRKVYKLKLGHAQAKEILNCICQEIPHFDATQQKNAGLNQALFKAVENDSYGLNLFFYAVSHRQEKIFSLIYKMGAKKNILATAWDKLHTNMLHHAA